MEREVSRGGGSEAKALAGAARGAGERSEAGRGDNARSAWPANGESAYTHRTENARGGMAGATHKLARRAA